VIASRNRRTLIPKSRKKGKSERKDLFHLTPPKKRPGVGGKGIKTDHKKGEENRMGKNEKRTLFSIKVCITRAHAGQSNRKTEQASFLRLKKGRENGLLAGRGKKTGSDQY